MHSRPNLSPLPNRRGLLVGGGAGLAVAVAGLPALADDDAAKMVADARQAMNRLLATDEDARRLNARGLAVLVFPGITKAGFIFGAQNGQGVMFRGRRVVGFYQITGGSFGLQAGAQKYGLALFFMNPQAIDYVRRNHGLSIGAGPSVVVANKGVSKGLSTTTGLQDVYAVAFDQRGLMAGLTLNGSRIAQITPSGAAA
jgi:lipid-binding SYLF domain-containing protein